MLQRTVDDSQWAISAAVVLNVRKHPGHLATCQFYPANRVQEGVLHVLPSTAFGQDMLLELLHSRETRTAAGADVSSAERVEELGRVPVFVQHAEGLARIRQEIDPKGAALEDFFGLGRSGGPFFVLRTTAARRHIHEIAAVATLAGLLADTRPMLESQEGGNAVRGIVGAQLRLVHHGLAVQALDLDAAVNVIEVLWVGDDGHVVTLAGLQGFLDENLLGLFAQQADVADLGALVVFDVAHQSTGTLEDGPAAMALEDLRSAVVLGGG